MNYLVQRGKVRGQVINVPEGLPDILSDITREVLRCQPTAECLCQFIIDYLHSVIIAREKALMARRVIERALRAVDQIISDMCICDLSKEKNEEMALLMEECFKRFLEKRRCEADKEKEIVKFHEEDMLDLLIQKCKFTVDELKLSRPAIEDAYNRFVEAYMKAAEGTDGTEALYMYFKERERQRKEQETRRSAAIRIQATFRGYRVRRELFIRQSEAQNSATENSDEVMDKAARTIQHFFREHRSKSHIPTDIDLKHEDDIGEICEPASELLIAKEAKMSEPSQVDASAVATIDDMSEQPEAKAAEKSEPEVAKEHAPAPAPEPEPQPQPEAKPPPQPEPEPEPEPEPVPIPQSEPETAPETPATETADEPAASEPPAEESNAMPEEGN